jgi:hypothetical protein
LYRRSIERDPHPVETPGLVVIVAKQFAGN